MAMPKGDHRAKRPTDSTTEPEIRALYIQTALDATYPRRGDGTRHATHILFAEALEEQPTNILKALHESAIAEAERRTKELLARTGR